MNDERDLFELLRLGVTPSPGLIFSVKRRLARLRRIETAAEGLAKALDRATTLSPLLRDRSEELRDASVALANYEVAKREE